MKQKLINKQAIVLVFIYSRMTARSRRGEADETRSHIKQRGSAGREGTMPLPLLRRVFPGLNKAGKVRVAIPNSRAPFHAGGGYWGEQETLCTTACHCGIGAQRDVASWGAFWRCRLARSHRPPAPGPAFPLLSCSSDAPQARRSLLRPLSD